MVQGMALQQLPFIIKRLIPVDNPRYRKHIQATATMVHKPQPILVRHNSIWVDPRLGMEGMEHPRQLTVTKNNHPMLEVSIGIQDTVNKASTNFQAANSLHTVVLNQIRNHMEGSSTDKQVAHPTKVAESDSLLS